mmetsp:Transcript_19679/g.38254  ORF Transcript_19679/g.38254 Transcript_19679/m.38254 type:complete len:236 (-) Transcript_19679:2548-3255(-)
MCKKSDAIKGHTPSLTQRNKEKFKKETAPTLSERDRIYALRQRGYPRPQKETASTLRQRGIFTPSQPATPHQTNTAMSKAQRPQRASRWRPKSLTRYAKSAFWRPLTHFAPYMTHLASFWRLSSTLRCLCKVRLDLERQRLALGRHELERHARLKLREPARGLGLGPKDLLGNEGPDGWGELESVAAEAVAEEEALQGGLADDRVDVVLVDSVHVAESDHLAAGRERGKPVQKAS